MSKLEKLLNSYISNERVYLQTQDQFVSFWQDACAHGVVVYKGVLRKKQCQNPITFAENCLEWLPERKKSRQLYLQLQDICDKSVLASMCWIERFKENPKAGWYGHKIFGLDIYKRSHHTK